MRRRGVERGTALLVTLLSMALIMALGAGLILASSVESSVASNFRHATGARYAADAMLEQVIGELARAASWTDVPSGLVASGFIDGAPGARVLADNRAVDLVEVLNLANCAKKAACLPADLDRITPERPWGAANPRWRLYAHVPAHQLLGGAPIDAPFYIVAMVADDPSDNDGDTDHDGLIAGGLPNPGSGIVSIRAEAFGPRGSHRVVEATIARIVTVPPGASPSVALLSRREVG